VLAGLVVLAVAAGDLGPGTSAPAAQREQAAAVAAPRVDLDIAGPATGTTFRRNVAVVEGTVDPPDAEIDVSGGPPRDLGGGRWRKRVRLHLGEQEIGVRATAAGHRTATAGVTVTRVRSAAERRQMRAAQVARERTFRAAAKAIPYSRLARDPDAHAGRKVRYTGQVAQIQEDLGGGWLLLAVTDDGSGLWTDNLYVEYEGAIPAAEDDVVTVLGTVRGQVSYRTQTGGRMSVPHVQARSIDA
jgi:hypothetical protein